jgi:hypothetical protein
LNDRGPGDSPGPFVFWEMRNGDAVSAAESRGGALPEEGLGRPSSALARLGRAHCFSLPSRGKSSERGNLFVPPHPFAASAACRVRKILR